MTARLTNTDRREQYGTMHKPHLFRYLGHWRFGAGVPSNHRIINEVGRNNMLARSFAFRLNWGPD